MDNLVAGNNLIYFDDSSTVCTNCTALVRTIVSIALGTQEGTKVLTTTSPSFRDLFDAEDYNIAVADTQVESLLDCSVDRRGIHRHLLESDKAQHGQHIPRFLYNECAPNWLIKNADGSCVYTNCVVGDTGSADNCFECTTDCDNGCGTDSIAIAISGDFPYWDFGPACCNHDYCWATTFGKEKCDRAFLDQMKNACPDGLKYISCYVQAQIFFRLVYWGGDSDFVGNPYEKAQADQKLHEKSRFAMRV